jgi:hypothetical protein
MLKHNTGIQRRMLRVGFGFLLCISAGTAWAGTVTACGGGTIATISGNAGSNPSGGCGQDDLGFSTFSVGNLGDGNTTTPTSSQITLATSGGTPGSTPTMAPIDLTFSSSGWTVTSGSSSTFNCPGYGSCNAMSSFVTLLAGPVSGADVPSGGGSWGIDGVALPLASIAGFSAVGTGIPTDAQIDLDLDVCVGVSTEAACIQSGPGANQAFLSVLGTWNGASIVFGTPTATCPAGSSNCNTAGNQLNFTTPYSQVFVDDADVFLIAPVATAGGDSYSLSLGSFSGEFDQVAVAGGATVPEPGTFGLLGVALAGIGLLRMRLR